MIIALSALIVAVLLLGALFYFAEEFENRNSKNEASAYLTTDLVVREIPRNYPYNVPSPIPFNYLYITGSAKNTGKGTVYSAGLHVVAYNAAGVLEINLTVPLINGASYGTDAPTNAYVSSTYGNSSLQLGNLFGEQNATIEIGIFHEGTVSNWKVTPLWTNSP